MVTMRPNWRLFSNLLREKSQRPYDVAARNEYAQAKRRLVKAGFLTPNRANGYGFRFDQTGKSEGVDGLYFTAEHDAVVFGNIHFGHGCLWEPTFFGDSMLGFGLPSGGATGTLTGR